MQSPEKSPEEVGDESSESAPTLDPDCLTREDCQYLLRALEKQAFKHVVCALRAQGPLSQYREVILDHLKAIFFISDEDCQLQLRISSNDPILSRIAEELNPSYDTCSEWMAAGYNLLSLELANGDGRVKETDGLAVDDDSVVSQMVQEMDRHNSDLLGEREALLRLLQVPKKPYVPEKLRRLLQTSEKDVNGRADVSGGAKEKLSPTHNGKADKVKGKEFAKKGGIKSLSKDENDIKQSVALLLSNASSSIDQELQQRQQNGQSPCGAPTKQHRGRAGSKTHVPAEFPVHRQGTNNVVVVDPEDQFSKEPKIRRKRMRHMDDGTFICARVMPFVFEPAQPGSLTKPVRGNPNPDKKLLKRISPHIGYPLHQADQRHAMPFGVPHHLGTSMLGNYYAAKTMQFGGYGEPHLQAKRIRANSLPDSSGRIVGEASPQSHLQTVIVPRVINSATPQHGIVHPDQAGLVGTPAQPPPSGAPLGPSSRAICGRTLSYQRADEEEPEMSSPQPAAGSVSTPQSTETSGLDFLASISASLLVLPQTPDTTPPASTTTTDQQSSSDTAKSEPEPSCSSNTFHPPLVDKEGVLIDQETTTLGTILADPALRGKFLSAAISRQQKMQQMVQPTPGTEQPPAATAAPTGSL